MVTKVNSGQSQSNIEKKPSWMDPSDYIFTVILPYLIWLPYQLAEMFSMRTVRRILVALGLRSAAATGAVSVADTGYAELQISQHLWLMRASQPTLSSSGERRIVLFFAWLTAKPRHLRKYAKLFADVGIDTLIIRTFPLDIMQPTTGSQIVGQKVCDFLKQRMDYEKYFIFGCSVGGYVFCETVLKMKQEPELVEKVLPRFVGQAYDSPVDLKGMAVGVAVCITSSKTLQELIRSYVSWFLRVRHQSVTRHYEAAAEVMYGCPLNMPGFYTYSTADPMSTAEINESIADIWRVKDIPLRSQVFEHEKNGHCRSYSTYPDLYRKHVYDFLEFVGMTDRPTIEAALKASKGSGSAAPGLEIN